MFTIKGEIHKISTTRPSVIDPTLVSRELILKYDLKGTTQYIRFLLFNARCKLPDVMKKGDQVIVGFDLKGREKKAANGAKAATFFANLLELLSIDLVVAADSASSPTTKRVRPRLNQANNSDSL